MTSSSTASFIFSDLYSNISTPSSNPMTRYDPPEPRTRSNSISAAWSYLWRGSKNNQHLPHGSPSRSANKHQTIKEEEDDEDKVLGKGITRKVLPQRRSTSSAHSSPAGSSRTSPRLEYSSLQSQQLQQQQQLPSALERIAIHNDNINCALASTIHHSLPLPPLIITTASDTKDVVSCESTSQFSTEKSRPHYHSQLRQQQQQQQHQLHQNRTGHGHQSNESKRKTIPSDCSSSTVTTSNSSGENDESREGSGHGSADSSMDLTTNGAHRSSSPASCPSVTFSSSLSPTSEKDNLSEKKDSESVKSYSSSSTLIPTSNVGLGLVGVHGSQEHPSDLPQFVTTASGPSYFDIAPISSPKINNNNNNNNINNINNNHTSTANPKQTLGFTTKTPGRRTKRTPVHSIANTITNSGMANSRRVSCTDTASQNSATFIDDQDLEVDENSFYIHLQKMQERHQTQQEPGWLRSQHAILQAKHRLPGSGSPQPDCKNTSAGKKSGLFNRIHSSNSSPSSSEYGSSPSHHFGPHHSRQSSNGNGSSQRPQPVFPINCFQPGNVICVPRERSLNGLIFHKAFVETHVLTPSPYFKAQFLTLDQKVVEIDRNYVREISGFSQPRSVQILAEEMVYNGTSKKPTRVLILERPLEGDVVVQSRAKEGPMMPNLRQFTSDMAFIESFPELSRALRDFNNLCQEFESTYVYIHGFATHTLEKLRLIYEKFTRDCVGDSVKLLKLLDQGMQAEQDCFSELMENIVLGKLYQKLFVHSLMPCYSQRDEDIDAIITKYYRFMFGTGTHKTADSGTYLVQTENSVLQDSLRKLGLSEKWMNMRVDHALDGAAGLFQAWDKGDQDDDSPLSLSSQRLAVANFLQESEQERKRQQLRESLRIYVQDDKYRPKEQQQQQQQQSGMNGHPKLNRASSEESNDGGEVEPEDLTANAIWNTPLEKAYCIKLVLDMINRVAEDYLVNEQGFGFMQKKRQDVSVTTDDFIPLLAIVIIKAKMLSLGSNLFYIHRFRINTPKPDLNFALVTFEASIEFLKKDPLGIMNIDHPVVSTTASVGSTSRSSIYGPSSYVEIEKLGPTDETPILWGTPSHTGWGFSPPKLPSESNMPSDLLKSIAEKGCDEATSGPSLDNRLSLGIRSSDSLQQLQQEQQRHARSASMNFDDRLRRVAQADELGGSSNNSSWSRSPMLGPRFTSGTNSPLASASPTHGVFSGPTEASPGFTARRSSYQLAHAPQRYSASSNQSHVYTHAHHNIYPNRISLDQGRDSIGRSTHVPFPSPNLSPQVVVKPHIMLPPPKTPPMNGQNTSVKARPMSMIMASGLGSSGYSSSYTGSGVSTTRKSFSSTHSSPATSPRLGPGYTGKQSGSRSNSLLSGSFPVVRANSTNSVTTDDRQRENDERFRSQEQIEGYSSSSIAPWDSQGSIQPPSQSPLLSSSPAPMESPVLTEPPTCLLVPVTPDSSKHLNERSATSPPNRIKMSPSSTMSSISTPTTPSTFSSLSGTALLDSLNVNSQIGSPPTPTSSAAPGLPLTKSSHVPETITPPTSSKSQSAPGSAQSQSGVKREPSARKHMPRLSLSLSHSPSAPSTAFCKTTVTAATRTTTSVDDLEPMSTIIAAEHYGVPSTVIAPPTPSPSTPSGRNSFSSEGRSMIGSRLKDPSGVGGGGHHQKADSGKYFVGGHISNHSSSSSKSNNSQRNSVVSDFGYGYRGSLDLDQSFRDDLCFDPKVPDQRRGSATSLRSGKLTNGTQPEKVIMLGWNQGPTGGSGIDNQNGGQRSNRASIYNNDLTSGSYSYSYSRPFTPIANSFIIDDAQERKKQMGVFLSELAKVEDGDVLIGHGRDGAVIRQ